MRVCLLAVSALLATRILSAQSAVPTGNDQAPPSNAVSYQDLSTFTLKQEVRNVVIDVTVTDKHGQSVPAIDKSHFKVFENGVPQDIAFFEEHKVEETTPAQPAPNLPPDTHSNLVTAPPGPLIVLLLDALNTRAFEQSYVRAQALDYLKQIPPGTHIAIFTLSDKLQLIQGFTSDPNILQAALDGRSYPQFVSLTAGSSTTASSVRASLNRWSNGSSDVAQELDINYTLDALNALSIYLSGIPGRKNLIWFAGTVPWTINPDFSLATSVTGRVDYSDALKQLANTMTRGRIAIYPIDAHALPAPTGFGADSAPIAGMGQRTSSPLGSTDNSGSPFGARGMGGSFGSNELHSQMNAAGNHMSMTNLAEATGGRAFYNTNGLSAAVAKVHEIADNYYTIIYSPKDKSYDGSIRKIDVQVSDPGVKLDYRRAYFAEDPAKTAKRAGVVYSNALRGVMQRGAPDATQIPFTIQATVSSSQPDLSRASDRIGAQAATLKGLLVRYDFHWNVDPKTLTFTPTSNGFHLAEVDATVAAYDVDGKVINNIYSTLPLNLSDAQYNRLFKTGLPMKQTLDIPTGVVYLRAGVEDPGTGHTGATEFPLMVNPAHLQTSNARPPTPH
jgi:VWFA-related protein